jgi:hypothetical protein
METQATRNDTLTAGGFSTVIPRPTPPINLLKKINAAMAKVTYIQKDKTNSFHKYNYASIDAIKDHVQAAFIEVGLVFTTTTKILSVATGLGKDQKESLTTVQLDYSLYDAASGESLSGSGVGTGMDSGDKGVYKAISGALKYILGTILLFATGDDDPEYDNTPKTQQPKPAAPPQKTETKPVPATSKPQVNHAPSTPTNEPRPQRPASVPGVVPASSIPEPPAKPFNGEDDTLPGRELPTPEEYKVWSTAAKEFMTANGIKTAQLKGYLKNYFEKGPAKVKEAGDLSKVPYQVLLAASKDLLTASNADTIKNFKPAETN